MKHEKSCGAVVYRIRYGYLEFLVEYMKKGHVSIPKGHVEGDETEEDTAVREIREETGLEVRLDTVFRHDVYYSPEEGVQKQVIFFVAEALSGDLKNQECEVTSLKWMPYDAAILEMTYDTDKDVLSHAAVYLGRKYHLWVNRAALCLSDSGEGLWYRENAVDIHGHIVVRVDDGAQTPEEAAELVRLDLEEGMRVAFATPHYGEENGYAPKRDNIWLGWNRLLDATRDTVPGMKILLGTEWYCSDHIVERIRRKEAFPMGDSDWYMVEFLEWGDVTEPAEVMLRRLKNLKDNGIKTILAHPERYRAIQQDWDLAKRIRDLGVLLQVNAYDLALNPKNATRELAQWMAEERLISFIGSDMHGTRIKSNGKPARRPQMKEGVRWLYEHTDDEYANEVVRVNAEKYLGVEKLLGN